MTKRNLILFRFSITLNIVLIIGIMLVAYKWRAEIVDRIVSFRINNSDKNTSVRFYTIVMYGNSLTAGGKWNTDLNRGDIRNSGIFGFTSSHFVWLLTEAVIRYKPKICFVEGGINDILVGIPLSRTYKNYESIVDTLLKYKIETVLQSTLYIHQAGDSISNVKVDSLNYFLSNLASKKSIPYIDLNKLVSENKRLKIEFTIDGIHLNESAYKIWDREIEKILELKGI